MGTGAIVIGLAAIVIGEVLGRLTPGKLQAFGSRLTSAVVGSVIYFIIRAIVLQMGMDANDTRGAGAQPGAPRVAEGRRALMLTLTHVTKTFNKGTVNEKPALTGVDLHLEPGDFVTVIGGNGAGKSTLLNCIAGVFPPDGGKIELDGRDVTRLPEHKRAADLGRVFQDPMRGTAADMQIDENLALAARRGGHRGLAWGITREEREDYHERLKMLDLGLSGGQRQALTLLMAVLKRPKLLLLDEHTAALDPKTAAKVLSLTQRLVQQDSLTTLMVTHNMHDAIRLGNRLIMMHEGHVIFDVRGDEKSKLTVADLLRKFEEAAGGELDNDRMLLS